MKIAFNLFSGLLLGLSVYCSAFDTKDNAILFGILAVYVRISANEIED